MMCGYNLAGTRGMQLMNSYCEGGSTSVYADTGATTNLTISHNIFRNAQQGITLNMAANQLDGVSILYNIVELNTNGSSAFVNYHEAHNIQIVGNVVRFAYNRTPPIACWAVAFGNVTGALIQGNIWHSQLGIYAPANQNNSKIRIFNNYDLSGDFATLANQTDPPNSITRRTISAAGSTTLALTDKYVGVQTASAVTLTLPTATSYEGKEIIVMAETSSAPSITIQRAGSETINGATSKTISSAYGVLHLTSDGANWFAY